MKMSKKKTASADASAVPSLLWPDEWDGNLRGSRRRSIKLFFGFVILAFFSILFSTDPVMIIMIASPALITLNFAITSYLASHIDLRRTISRVSLQQAKHDSKLFIPIHRWYKALYHLTNVSVSAFGLLWVYIGALGEYDGRRVIFVYLAAFTFGPLMTIWGAVRTFSRILFRLRGPQMGIAISESGVSQTSWWGEVHTEWRFIEGIRVTNGMAPRMFGRGKRPTYVFGIGLVPTARGRKRLRGHFPSLPVTSWPLAAYRGMMIDVAELDVYPPVVPHLVKFYFDHPELRNELGTEKALQRIRTGDFVA